MPKETKTDNEMLVLIYDMPKNKTINKDMSVTIIKALPTTLIVIESIPVVIV